MDAIVTEALSQLDVVVANLLPIPVPAGLQRQLSIVPLEIKPTGLGGYIGINPEPQAAVFGRKIRAAVAVSVSGGQANNVADHLNVVVKQLLSQANTDLRISGIFKLQLQDLPPAANNTKSANFEISYEYQKIPAAPDGMINTLDFDFELGAGGHNLNFLWDVRSANLATLPNPLAEFTIADDPDVNANSPASAWSYNAVQKQIEQNSAIRGGVLTSNVAKKAGGQLLWRPKQKPLKLRNFIAIMDFVSTSQDGIGLVFNRVDNNNFYYVVLSNRHNYALAGKKVDSNYSFIGNNSVNDASGFALNTPQNLKVTVADGEISVYINGNHSLTVTETAPMAAGEIGFLTHSNNGARFLGAKVIELS